MEARRTERPANKPPPNKIRKNPWDSNTCIFDLNMNVRKNFYEKANEPTTEIRPTITQYTFINSSCTSQSILQNKEQPSSTNETVTTNATTIIQRVTTKRSQYAEQLAKYKLRV